MIEQIPSFVGVSSPIATALAMFYLIFTGRLYVRSAHEAVVRVLENQLAALTIECATWRDSSLGKDETIRLLSSTNAEFVESAKFQDHVMAALQSTATGRTP